MSSLADKLAIGWAVIFTGITVTSFIILGMVALAVPLTIIAGLLGLFT